MQISFVHQIGVHCIPFCFTVRATLCGFCVQCILVLFQFPWYACTVSEYSISLNCFRDYCILVLLQHIFIQHTVYCFSIYCIVSVLICIVFSTHCIVSVHIVMLQYTFILCFSIHSFFISVHIVLFQYTFDLMLQYTFFVSVHILCFSTHLIYCFSTHLIYCLSAHCIVTVHILLFQYTIYCFSAHFTPDVRVLRLATCRKWRNITTRTDGWGTRSPATLTPGT